jgi:hypothetical protein
MQGATHWSKRPRVKGTEEEEDQNGVQRDFYLSIDWMKPAATHSFASSSPRESVLHNFCLSECSFNFVVEHPGGREFLFLPKSPCNQHYCSLQSRSRAAVQYYFPLTKAANRCSEVSGSWSTYRERSHQMAAGCVLGCVWFEHKGGWDMTYMDFEIWISTLSVWLDG